MRSGPIEPGSIREAIVAMYWIQRQQAEAYRTMALALAAPEDRFEQVNEMIQRFMQGHLPFSAQTSKQTIETMQSQLQEWVKRGRIGIPQEAVESSLHKSRAVQKFAGAFKQRGSGLARRRTPLSHRDRPTTG